MLSPKIENIALSGTMEIAAKTLDMKKRGINVIDLCVGESDLPTPKHIKEAAQKAIVENKTRYTSNVGIVELREAVCEKFKNEYGADYSNKEVIISNGAKQAVYNTLQSIITNGDEVILPIPYYVSYPPMIQLAGGVPVFVKTKTSNSYKITYDELVEAITPKSKALLLCNPNNPSGSLYSKEELEKLLELAYKKGLYIISDEIYEKFIYDNRSFTSIAHFSKYFKDKLIIINGVSKAYAMTGWRIGYAVAPSEIISGMNKLQSHTTSNACTISQYAALAALKGTQSVVEDQRKVFESRRTLVHKLLQDIKGIKFVDPHGAFYFFINIAEILDNNSDFNTSKEFCIKLLDEIHVAIVPGTVFGMEGYVRISYAKSEKDLIEALDRIKKLLAGL